MSVRIIGIDEVGTGSIAGPVVLAAVSIEPGTVEGVRDSKLVAEEKRYVLGDQIRAKAEWCAIAQRNVESIEEHSVKQCWRAMILELAHAAVERFGKENIEIQVDGPNDNEVVDRARKLKLPIRFVPNGDDDVYQISAASLVAKSFRDRIMLKLGAEAPQYGFETHKGYATSKHLDAIRRHGVCCAHRLRLVQSALKDGPEDGGKSFSEEVADYSPAEAKGYAEEILARKETLSDFELKYATDMKQQLDMRGDLSPRQKFFLKKIAKRTKKMESKQAKRKHRGGKKT